MSDEQSDERTTSAPSADGGAAPPAAPRADAAASHAAPPAAGARGWLATRARHLALAVTFLTAVRLPDAGAAVPAADLWASMAFYPLVGLLLGLAGLGPLRRAALRRHAAAGRRPRDRGPRARHAGAAPRRPHGHGRRLPERRAARARPRDHEGQPGRRHGRLCRRGRDRRQGERARCARALRRRPGSDRRPERGPSAARARRALLRLRPARGHRRGLRRRRHHQRPGRGGGRRSPPPRRSWSAPWPGLGRPAPS